MFPILRKGSQKPAGRRAIFCGPQLKRICNTCVVSRGHLHQLLSLDAPWVVCVSMFPGKICKISASPKMFALIKTASSLAHHNPPDAVIIVRCLGQAWTLISCTPLLLDTSWHFMLIWTVEDTFKRFHCVTPYTAWPHQQAASSGSQVNCV